MREPVRPALCSDARALQSEMLLDMRIIQDPAGLFYCGDTAQTIARGLGFRFEARCVDLGNL